MTKTEDFLTLAKRDGKLSVVFKTNITFKTDSCDGKNGMPQTVPASHFYD